MERTQRGRSMWAQGATKMGLVVRGRASSGPGWPEGVLGALACCWLVNGAHSLRSVLRAMCKNELCQTCEYIDGEL